VAGATGTRSGPLVAVRFQDNAPLGVVAPALEELGVPWRYCDAWREPLPEPTDVAGLIVLGGSAGADDAEPEIADARTLLRDAVDAGLPVLGICLGAQLLGRALGGAVRRLPVPEIGFCTVRATTAGADDPLLGDFAPATRVFQFHEDAVDLPDGATLLFTGEAVPVQAFRAGGRAWGVQFHLEVDTAIITGWCAEIGEERLADYWRTSEAALLADAERLLPAQQRLARAATAGFAALLA
jgi:GMP synthase (glutamine-hydrolysing)